MPIVPRTYTRRRVLLASAAAAAALACREDALVPPRSPSPAPAAAPPSAAPPSPAPVPPRGVLVRAGAFADGTSRSAQRAVSLLVRGSRVEYLGPRDGEPDVRNAEVVDLPGGTIVPGLVDCHAHLTGAGGLAYLATLQEPDGVLLARAEENARVLVRTGVLAARDVGAVRAQNVAARDRLRGRTDAPIVQAAGTWVARRGRYQPFAVQVDDAAGLRDAALAQLDLGADLVKVGVDAGTGSASHWTASELRPMVEAVHARGKRVAGHAQGHGARAAAEAGFDSIDHGYWIDRATADAMRGRTALVTTLSVPVAFGNAAELEQALAAVRAARAAGVLIATGTDFGGGPPRPGNFALEVELLVRAGLEPHEALAAATRSGGTVMGLPGLGTLARGTAADLLVVDGDPLADVSALRRILAVFRDGVRVA